MPPSGVVRSLASTALLLDDTRGSAHSGLGLGATRSSVAGGSFSSISGSGGLGTKLEDWAVHWPFPTFEKQPPAQSDESAGGGGGGLATLNAPNSSSASLQRGGGLGNARRPMSAAPQFGAAKAAKPAAAATPAVTVRRLEESDSSDDDDQPAPLAPCHPLASDWLSDAWALDRSSDRLLLSRPTTATLSRSPSLASIDGRAPWGGGGAAPSGRTVVTKDEITSLISVYNSANAVASEVDMHHIDCRWLQQRDATGRVAPPSLYLHLGNLTEALDAETIRDRQVLINSPRSAIILLRSGTTLDELKRDRRGVPSKRALADMSWEEKKLLALEKARQRKLAALLSEYRALDDTVCSFEHVVAFCNSFDAARPSTALAAAFPTDTRPATPLSRLPSEITRQQTTAMRQKVQQRIDRAAHSRLETQRLEQEQRERVVAQQLEKQRAVDRRLEQQRAAREAQRVISEGKAMLWQASHDRSQRVSAFRRLVARERMERRLDEVTCIQRELRDAGRDFQGWVRQTRLEVANSRAQEDASFLRRARQQFLSSQV